MLPSSPPSAAAMAAASSVRTSISPSLSLSAAAMKDRKENFTAQASMAKLFASEMVNRVTAKALQIHGGYGYMEEYRVCQLYRDVRCLSIFAGTSEIMKLIISRGLGFGNK